MVMKVFGGMVLLGSLIGVTEYLGYEQETKRLIPHVHFPDGHVHMISPEQAEAMAQQGQDPGSKPGWCIDGEHLPKNFPEGSETGCACGAHCDENGHHTGPEPRSCERYCNKDKCKCGMCI